MNFVSTAPRRVQRSRLRNAQSRFGYCASLASCCLSRSSAASSNLIAMPRNRHNSTGVLRAETWIHEGTLGGAPIYTGSARRARTREDPKISGSQGLVCTAFCRKAQQATRAGTTLSRAATRDPLPARAGPYPSHHEHLLIGRVRLLARPRPRLASHVVIVLALVAGAAQDREPAGVTLLLTVAGLGDERRRACVLRLAHHLALKDGTLPAGHAHALVRSCAPLPIGFAATITQETGHALFLVVVVVLAVESQLVLDGAHGFPKALTIAMMAARAGAVFVRGASPGHVRCAAAELRAGLASFDEW